MDRSVGSGSLDDAPTQEKQVDAILFYEQLNYGFNEISDIYKHGVQKMGAMVGFSDRAE